MAALTNGSGGVAAKLSSTPGAIGYVDVAYSLNNHLTFAAVQNRAGKFQLPGLIQIQAAIKSLKKLQSKDNSITVVDPNPRAKNAYPICTFTYVIVPLKSSKASDLKPFIKWALTSGQQYGPKLRFVPITPLVLKADEKTLARVHS